MSASPAHDVLHIIGRVIGLLKPRTLSAARAFFRAMRAYHKSDYETALTQLDKSIELDALLRTDVNMAFRTLLLVLSKRPPQEAMEAYKRIVAGEFTPHRSASKYARAYSDYWLGHLTSRPDIIALWSRAYGLRPAKGFVATYLPLPKSPILSDVLRH